MAEIIDGRSIAQDIQKKIGVEIRQKGLEPSLVIILIGNDPASQLYINLKKKACEKVGIEFHEYLMAEKVSEEHILETIDFLNKDEQTDAILIQLPLPQHLNTNKIIEAINIDKDVDGFHPQNIKKILNNENNFIPGLPLGIIKLLESTKEDLKNKEALIISKSDVFYKPLKKLLEDKEIITKIIKPNASNLITLTKKADILITAIGKPFFIKKEMVKKGSIIIDIGTNKIDQKYIVGDVDYTSVFPKVSYITPVPGGVGPMTVAMLLYNTLKLHKIKRDII